MRSASASVVLLACALAPAVAHAGPDVTASETVVLFPTLATRDGDAWVVPLHAWVGDLEPRSLWRRLAVRGLRKLLGPRDATEAAALDARARWLLADDHAGKRVTVGAAGVEVTLPPTDAAGHARGHLRAPARAAPGDALALEARAPDGRRFPGRALLVGTEGLLVVTDVDDTIRVSQVAARARLVRRTLVEPLEPVLGMADLLQGFARGSGAVVYLSAMPTQLAGVLTSFLEANGFPQGELALRELRDDQRRRLRFDVPPALHKDAVLADLLVRFPRRRLVLVGDSGEQDPEIYGAFARAHPAHVALILIRQVPGAPMDADRRARAFEGVATPVELFTDPARVERSRAVPRKARP